jgi:hypothetical protein
VSSSAPIVRVDAQPSAISGARMPAFLFAAVWAASTHKNGTVPDATFAVSIVGVSPFHSPCDETGARPNCTTWCNGTRCEYTPTLDRPGAYTLQVRAVLFSKAGDVSTVLWEYKRCSSTEFSVFRDGDAIECSPCPIGGDCSTVSVSEVVEQKDIIAQAGWWASDSSSGKQFYKCPIPESCLPGDRGNGTRAQCQQGYGHVACSVCVDGYFEQFGKCAACPATATTSYLTVFGVVVIIFVFAGILFKIRELLPLDVLKIGVSMAQIIGSANSAYEIPWPPLFTEYLNAMKVFLVSW